MASDSESVQDQSAQESDAPNSAELEAPDLTRVVVEMLESVETPPEDAALVASSLIDADLSGVASHGVQLVPMYIDRILAGSVDPTSHIEIAVETDAVAVVDCRNGLGQVTGTEAMNLAISKAGAFGVGLVAARNAFHFGVASRYSLMAAEQGKIGLASCNTRPLMPAPGGADRVVGNNPISIALPTADEVPFVIDIALSEAAMGKIRLAASSGSPIPSSWATDESGNPTTDPVSAIAGMLLPTGSHKGFGLALVVDLLCGLLAGGGYGEEVAPLYGDLSVPYNSSHLFLAIDVERFRPVGDFREAVAAAAARVRSSTRAPGISRVYTPGEKEALRRRSTDGTVVIDASVLRSLQDTANKVGVTWTLADNSQEGDDR